MLEGTRSEQKHSEMQYNISSIDFLLKLSSVVVWLNFGLHRLLSHNKTFSQFSVLNGTVVPNQTDATIRFICLLFK